MIENGNTIQHNGCYLRVEREQQFAVVIASSQYINASISTGDDDAKLDVVQTGNVEQHRNSRQRHIGEDGERFRVQDVDGATLGAQNQTTDGVIVGHRLFQGLQASDNGLVL